MAYWKNSKVTDIGAIGKDWVAKTAYRIFKTLQSKNKFYELEPAEVLEIALNEESLPKTEDGNPHSFILNEFSLLKNILRSVPIQGKTIVCNINEIGMVTKIKSSSDNITISGNNLCFLGTPPKFWFTVKI